MSLPNRQGLRGYVSSRGFGGYRIPVPLQSLALRDYCQRKGKLYVLPVNENIFENSYLVLDGMVQDLSAHEGVIMASMHMLPKNPDHRREVLRRILDQSCSLHFVIEDIVISKEADCERLEELLQLYELASRVPQEIVVE